VEVAKPILEAVLVKALRLFLRHTTVRGREQEARGVREHDQELIDMERDVI
jgi:hypothetical protein